jgi:hypothetical protein
MITNNLVNLGLHLTKQREEGGEQHSYYETGMAAGGGNNISALRLGCCH